MKNDLVYILGTGSAWQNNEIRYSLRSVEMFLQDFGNVYIIGNRPTWFNEHVIEIPAKDLHKNKARNIMEKIYIACCDPRISENFMLFNDDYFLLKNISAINYPYYYKCDLNYTVKVNVGEYQHHAQATLDLMLANNLPIFNFDSHYPIIYNKTKFRTLVEKLNLNIPYGFIARSTYCNYYGIKGFEKPDCKISHPYRIERIQQLNEHRECFSTSEQAINLAMQKYLKQLYPNKSKYEI